MQDVKIDRWKYIGGSDVPVIMGLVNYGRSRWDLLCEKAQLLNDDFDGNVFTEYGNTMEEVIRDYINFRLDTNFVEDKRIVGDYRYHADGFDLEKKTLLEIKTTGEIYGSARDYKKYLVQLLYGMGLFGVSRGILAVYARPDDLSTELDPDRLSIFPIEFDDYGDIAREVAKAVDDFVMDMYFLRDNPAAAEEDLPSRNALLPLASQVVALEEAMRGYKELEAQYKEMKAKLKTAMENAGIKSWTLSGGTKITLVPDGEDKMVDTFDEKSFARDHTELYEQYVAKKLSRGRAGYVKITMAKGAI